MYKYICKNLCDCQNKFFKKSFIFKIMEFSFHLRLQPNSVVPSLLFMTFDWCVIFSYFFGFVSVLDRVVPTLGYGILIDWFCVGLCLGDLSVTLNWCWLLRLPERPPPMLVIPWPLLVHFLGTRLDFFFNFLCHFPFSSMTGLNPWSRLHQMLPGASVGNSHQLWFSR